MLERLFDLICQRFGQWRFKCRFVAEVDVLAVPPVLVEAVFTILDHLPLVTDSYLGVSFDHFQGPRVDVLLHDTVRATGGTHALRASIDKITGEGMTLVHRCRCHEDQFGAGVLQLGNDRF